MQFIRAKDIQKMTGLSKDRCHKIIQSLNNELKVQGYMTLKGQVPLEIFEERFGIKR